jgi:PAS domain S-box-containing protein
MDIEAEADDAGGLTHVLDTLPAMVWTAPPDGNVDVINRRWRGFLGEPPDGAGTCDWKPSIQPQVVADVGADWRSSLRSGEEGEVDPRARRFDYEYEAVLVRCSPMHDEHGRIFRWCAMVTKPNRGIHQRRPDLRAPAPSAEDLQLTIDTIPAAVWSARPDGSADFFNQHYLDYLGLPLAEVLGWGWTGAIHPDDLAGLQDNWRSLTTTGQAGEAEARIRRYDGEFRWFLFRTTPHRDHSGNVVKWYGLNTDIEDRKQMEGRLRRSEAFLAEGQHLARMGNLSWRIATGEIIWSEPLYRIFEFEPGTVVTLDRIAERVPREDVPMMMDMIARAQRGEMDFEYQHRIKFPDGRVKHLHLIAHRASDRDEVEYNGAVLDITQRRVSEETLEKVRSELAQITRIMSLGALTASIAHEVNQPLSGIVTNAGTCLRMLSADPPNIEIAKETARRTIRDGNRAADIIAQLRSLFSRKALAHQAVDLNEAAREVLALLAGDLHRSNVVLSTGFAEELPPVAGDRIQLQQVIMNLVRNAADAMEDIEDRPRVLMIGTGSDEGNVKLTVRDTGPGFGSDDPDRIFQAFYTTKSDGMGIGLSVSRSIIESHGGRLWAEINDGPGASLSFTLPHVVDGDAGSAAAGSARVPAPSEPS